MFNLLPNQSKKIILKDYLVRRYSIIFMIIVFVQVWFVVLLLPSLVTSYFKEKDLSYQVELIKESDVSKDASVISDLIISTNTKLSFYENDFSYPQIIPILENLLSYKSSLVKFTDFMYEASSNSSAKISIRGNASTRDSLVSFVQKIEESGLFKEVDLPISNLAKDRNIDFAINLYFEN